MRRSPANHARLDEIRENAQRLADPRRISPSEAEAIIRTQAVILWIQGSIHGFELSGTEGMLLLLEHLTTRNDEATLRALEDAVILVEPVVNPDGRDAFAHHNLERMSRWANLARDDWSNDFTSWQAVAFRTNHYFFDNNRDWTAQTQRENRARARAILEWRPQALVDAHEWTPDVEFFFPHNNAREARGFSPGRDRASAGRGSRGLPSTAKFNRLRPCRTKPEATSTPPTECGPSRARPRRKTSGSWPDA